MLKNEYDISSHSKALKDIEKNIAIYSKNAYLLQLEIDSINSKLIIIQNEVKANQANINIQSQQVHHAIMAQLYSLNSSHIIKQILSKGAQEQHSSYLYKKLQHDQVNAIEKTAKILATQNELLKKLKFSLSERQQKEKIYKQQISASTRLLAQKSELLELAKNSFSLNHNTLSKLQEDETLLSKQILSIRRSFVNNQSDKFKGSLILPVKLSLSTFQLNYPIIRVQANSPVHAVAAGKVVFADWLKGFGLLLILDHGNGYMSLYGHNQTLLKEPGQIVRQGEAVSLVGNSGGHLEASLFFELRKDGQQISNLNRWFKS